MYLSLSCVASEVLIAFSFEAVAPLGHHNKQDDEN